MQKGMEPVWYWVEQPLQTGWWMGIAWVESNQLSAISTEKYTSFRILKQIHITCPESTDYWSHAILPPVSQYIDNGIVCPLQYDKIYPEKIPSYRSV